MNLELLLSKLPSHERNIVDLLIKNEPKNIFTTITCNNEALSDDDVDHLLGLIAKYSIEKGLELFSSVFAHISTDNAKQSIKSNPLLQSNHSFTYGDVEFPSFINIMQRCEPQSGDKFVDLGHGTGRALVAASIVFGTTLSSIHGIELLPELVELSRQSVASYTALLQTSPHKELFSDGPESRCAISIEEGDFLLAETGRDVAAASLNSDWTQAG